LLRKVIRYTGFDDKPYEEEGMYGHIEKIVREENRPELIKLFKQLLLMSYGKRSEDGRRFTKNEAILEYFQSTGMYSAALIDILSSTENAIEFYRGILPNDLTSEEAKEAGLEPKVTSLMAVEKEKIYERDLIEMDREKMAEAMSRVAEGSAEIVRHGPQLSQ
jgi:hypothetical protein